MAGKSKEKIEEERRDLIKEIVNKTIAHFFVYDPTTDIWRGTEYIAGEVMNVKKQLLLEKLD